MAIERGAYHVLHDVHRTGPGPLRELERVHGAELVTRCRRWGYLQRAPAQVGELYTLGAAGRAAIGLDRSYRPEPAALADALVRRAAHEVMRAEGWHPCDLDDDPRHAGAALTRRYARGTEGLPVIYRTVLAAARDPHPATVKRALDRLEGDELLVVVARDVAPLAPMGVQDRRLRILSLDDFLWRLPRPLREAVRREYQGRGDAAAR